MTYQEFILSVRDGIAARCDEEDEVIIKNITKNNGLKLDALVVQRKGRAISPSIYLKRYFEEYQDGMSLEQILDTIMFIEKNCKLECELEPDRLNSFLYVKDHVCCKLVNAERNAKLLLDTPHRLFHDLAIVYFVMVETKDDSMASFLIREGNCRTWKVTEEELYDVAMANTFSQFPVTVSSMQEVIRSMMPPDASQEMISAVDMMSTTENGQMFVVTNSRKTFGATAMLYDEFLETFAKTHGDFIILPSSIHEVIFLTKVEQPDVASLREMVSCVNESDLSVDEVLSDSVYYYSLSNKRVETLSCA